MPPSTAIPLSSPLASPSPGAPTSVRALYAQVWLHARGARARLVAALAMLGGSQLLKLALPWMAAQAINALQAEGRAGLRVAGGWIGAMLALHVGVWLLHGPARVLERGVALKVRRSVADALYVRLAHAPLAWHEGHHSGDLQHRVGQASTAMSTFTQSQFIYLQNLIHLVGPLVALSLLSGLTGAIACVGVVLIGALVLRFDRALMRLATCENQAERRYTARLLDFVGNISAIASLRLQRATRRLLDARLLAVFEPLSRTIVLTEWKWCAVDLLTIGLGWALVVAYALSSSSAAAGGTVLIGSLFMVYQYAQQAGGVLCSMAANFQGLAQTQANHASAEPIRHAPQPAAPGLPTPAPDWQVLALHDIGYAHAGASEGRGGVHGVTLTLRRGERVALVGPSGSGKSTLLRLLAGLYEAQQGSLRIDGRHEPARRHAGELATLIPQEAEIFEASVRDNLTFGEPVTAAELQRAVAASALDEVLAGLPRGLDTPLAERGFNLSGGQRQRLALARGVLAARHSSLLLLDEPTSALDPLIEQHVHERIDRAFAGACIVASVHRLTLLAHFDRVVFMAEGRIVDVGTPAELAARQPVFAAMWRRSGARIAAGRVQPGDRRATPPPGHTMTSDTSPLSTDDDASGDIDGIDDAITLLVSDHEEVRQLFVQFDELVSEGASDALREDVARQICAALTAHATIEEELFYPAARDALGDDDLLDTAIAEHAAAKDLIARIEGMDASDDLYDATVRMLQEAIDHHVEEEESELFPQVQDSAVDLVSLGGQLAQRKDEVLAELEDKVS